jgi:hypothetical protein
MNGWLTPEELAASCATSIPGLLRPHPRQSVRCLRDLVGQWHDAPRWPLGSPGDRGLVILAVDALTYESAREWLSSDELLCLTSSFPSTSVVSWLSSVTGAPPGVHGVAGPVAVRAGVTGVYNVIRSSASEFVAGALAVARPEPPAGAGGTTLFDDLSRRGVPSTVLVGDFLGICEGWIGELTRGGARRDPPRVLDDIRLDPRAVATLALEQVERELAGSDRRCVWAYVNLDEHIHHHGYDAVLRVTLARLQAAAERWAALGHTVLLYSDHGQIANRCVPDDLAAFDAVSTPEWCRLPPGGAGRVRWLYPHPSREAFVLRRLSEALGDHAFVCHGDELPSTGLTDAAGLPGVGRIVVAATGPRFPVPDPRYQFEHGSATAEEMLVPLAIWGPR